MQKKTEIISNCKIWYTAPVVYHMGHHTLYCGTQFKSLKLVRVCSLLIRCHCLRTSRGDGITRQFWCEKEWTNVPTSSHYYYSFVHGAVFRNQDVWLVCSVAHYYTYDVQLTCKHWNNKNYKYANNYNCHTFIHLLLL